MVGVVQTDNPYYRMDLLVSDTSTSSGLQAGRGNLGSCRCPSVEGVLDSPNVWAVDQVAGDTGTLGGRIFQPQQEEGTEVPRQHHRQQDLEKIAMCIQRSDSNQGEQNQNYKKR